MLANYCALRANRMQNQLIMSTIINRESEELLIIAKRRAIAAATQGQDLLIFRSFGASWHEFSRAFYFMLLMTMILCHSSSSWRPARVFYILMSHL